MGYRHVSRDPGLVLKQFLSNHTQASWTRTAATFTSSLKFHMGWFNSKKLRAHPQVTVDHIITTWQDRVTSRRLKEARGLYSFNVWVSTATFRGYGPSQKNIRYNIGKEMRKILHTYGQDRGGPGTTSTVLQNSGVRQIIYQNDRMYAPENIGKDMSVLRWQFDVELQYFETV